MDFLKLKITKQEFKKEIFFAFVWTIFLYAVILFGYTAFIFVFERHLDLDPNKSINIYFNLMWELIQKHWYYILTSSFLASLILTIIWYSRKKDKKYEKEIKGQKLWFYDQEKNMGSIKEYNKEYSLDNLNPGWVINYSKTKGKINYKGINLSLHPINFKILGGTRSGKTQKFVIPILKYNINLLNQKNKPNLVVADPKGELNLSAKEDLKKNNYREIILDITNPLSSIGFNMLNMVWDTFHSTEGKISKNHALAIRMLNEIIESLKNWSTQGENSMWDNNAKNAILGIGKFMLFYSLYEPSKLKRENFNLASFAQFLNISMFSKNSNWAKFFEDLLKTKESEIKPIFSLRDYAKESLINLYRDELFGLFNTVETTLTGILTNAYSVMNLFSSNAELKSFTSRGDLDVRELLMLSDPKYINSNQWREKINYFKDEINHYQSENKNTLTKFKNPMSFLNLCSLYKKNIDLLENSDKYLNEIGRDIAKVNEFKKQYEQEVQTLENEINLFIKIEELNLSSLELKQLIKKYFHNIKMLDYYEAKINLYNEESKPFALFIKFPDHEKSKNLMVNIIIDQIYKIAIEIANANNGSLNRFLLNIFDEFGNLPVLNDFGSKLSIALSRKVAFLIILQAYSQLDKYKKDQKGIILENTGLSAFISSDNDDTVKAISDALGKIKLEKISYTKNADSKDSQNSSLGEKELMTTSEIKQLDKNTHLIFRMQNLPLKLKSTSAHTIWDLKTNKQQIANDIQFNEKEYILDYKSLLNKSAIDKVKNGEYKNIKIESNIKPKESKKEKLNANPKDLEKINALKSQNAQLKNSIDFYQKNLEEEINIELIDHLNKLIQSANENIIKNQKEIDALTKNDEHYAKKD
ncbi:conjugal transfer coupling protein TraG [Mycoplasmopsis citelli]|uniref:Conjugal transfer coupling protein TraG n=1 Tax=Mycoplasmopsis citelli TaxID=171281 RepID=A0A449B106_9BACT|nr:TraM recognition domain-containing protein [Mycoplasmopsis citelli]VEU74282.1 conjugal transfer coupling protein TraG [Mycoplasmopsis citelli]